MTGNRAADAVDVHDSLSVTGNRADGNYHNYYWLTIPRYRVYSFCTKIKKHTLRTSYASFG
jgi:hypothetical protein